MKKDISKLRILGQLKKVDQKKELYIYRSDRKKIQHRKDSINSSN